MMRPLFLGRAWRIRRFAWWAGRVLWMLLLPLAVVAGFYAMKVLVGLARIVSQVCP